MTEQISLNTTLPVLLLWSSFPIFLVLSSKITLLFILRPSFCESAQSTNRGPLKKYQKYTNWPIKKRVSRLFSYCNTIICFFVHFTIVTIIVVIVIIYRLFMRYFARIMPMYDVFRHASSVYSFIRMQNRSQSASDVFLLL